MKKRKISNGVKKTIWLFLAAVIVITGCAQRGYEQDTLAVEPNIAALVVPGDYASSAIGATGGINAWTKTIQLELDCVVTCYSDSVGDKSGVSRRQPSQRHPSDFYLTEQHFTVYPWSNSIRISAQEPHEKFVWQLAGEKFSMLEGNKAVGVSPMVISYHDYAEAVLSIITVPVRFLDKPAPLERPGQALSGVEGSVSFVKSPAPVRKEGLWYYPIELNYVMEPVASADIEQKVVEPMQRNFPKVVFFQSKDSSLVDMIWFADRQRLDGSRFLAVRGYDYQKVRKDGVLVPAKIEIFRSDARAVLRERLVKIDFKFHKPS